MGRPKGAWSEKRFRDALQIAISEPKPDGLPRLRTVVERLVAAAELGEGWAIKEVADRLDGKPAQAIIGGDENDPPIRQITEIRNTIVDPRDPNSTGI